MKIIVIGPRGKMGKLITQVAASRDDMELIAGVAPKGRDYIGTDLGTVAMVGRELGVPVVDDLEKVIDACDVIIDFSTKEMGMEVLDLALAHKKGLVCGTTGFSPEEMARFEDASKEIPMLYAANTSKLVNIMNKLLELVVCTAGNDLDIEILEMHDQWKKDAPSGTSKEMGEIMAEALGKELKDIAVAVAEKVIHISLRSSGSVISRMIEAETEKLQKMDWVKIYMEKEDYETMVQADGHLAEKLSRLSDNVKFIVMEDGKCGSCIIEMPDGIIDMSVDTQLENIHRLVGNANT